MAPDRFDVLRGGVAEIPVPAVLGVFLREFPHEFVAVRLGEDGGGGDAGEGGVAMHHGAEILEPVPAEGAELVAVDEEEIRCRVQLHNRPLHSRDGGPEDVEPVDFFRLDGLHRPGDRFGLDDGPQLLPRLLGHLLGVVQERVVEVRRQDHGGGVHRPGEGAAPGLVAPRFEPSRFQAVPEMDFLHVTKGTDFLL